MIGFSVPVFVVGYMLIYVFSINLRWLPVQGYSPIAQGLGPWIERLILPSIALGLAYVALIARITRTSMLEVLAEDYIRTARAKGVATRSMLLKHALKNAGVPIVTVIGIGVALLIGGVVITETVFNIPGVGRLVVDAISKRDYPIIQGVILIFSGVYVLVNLLVDLTYTAARSEDPLLSVITAEPALVAAHGARAARSCAASRGAIRPSWRAARSSASSRCSRSRRRCSPATPITMQPAQRLRPPSEANWLGTDHLGRDVFARTVYGARVSLFVGISVAAMSISVGLFIGLLSGYFRKRRCGGDAADGRPDGDPGDPARDRAGRAHARQRLHRDRGDHHSRKSRAWCGWCAPSCSSVREAPYVEAAVAGGTPTWKILLRHILPNTIAPLIVQATYICASAILIEAGALVPRRRHAAGDPDLGQHDRAEPAVPLARAVDHLRPGIALALVVLAVNLLGDGLRDRLDPRLARRM